MGMERKLDMVDTLQSLPSVHNLQLDLNPPAKDNFEMIMPRIFNAIEHIKIECVDQDTLDDLEKFLRTTESFKKLSHIKLNKGPNFRQFFADMNYSEQYIEYLYENIGQLVDLL